MDHCNYHSMPVLLEVNAGCFIFHIQYISYIHHNAVTYDGQDGSVHNTSEVQRAFVLYGSGTSG